jgi:hypothetical protein
MDSMQSAEVDAMDLKSVLVWCKENTNSEKAGQVLSVMKRFGCRSVKGMDETQNAIGAATTAWWNKVKGKKAGDPDLSSLLAQPMKAILSEAFNVQDVYGFVSKLGRKMEDFSLSCGYENIHEFIDDFTLAKRSQWSFEELESFVSGMVVVPPGEAKSSGITAEQLCEKFGLRGVKSLWTESQVWQSTLNHLNDALTDLATVLQLSGEDLKTIGFKGRLAIQIGLESGDFTGLCGVNHDGSVTISLDGRTGWSALAHEWWHACDNQLSNLSGEKDVKIDDFFSEKMLEDKTWQAEAPLRTAMTDVIQSIWNASESHTEKIQTMWSEERASIKQNYFDRFILPKLGAERAEIEFVVNRWMDSLTEGVTAEAANKGLEAIVTACPTAGRYLSYIQTEVECAIQKEANLSKKSEDSMFRAFARHADAKMKETGVSSPSTGSGYTESIVEMTARSFESSLVADELSCMNRLSRALTGMNDQSRLYPQGVERVAQNKAWKAALPEIMDVLRKDSRPPLSARLK